MNQLDNPIITESIVRQRQSSLRHARQDRPQGTKASRRPIRSTIGTALIRFGESIRGRSDAITPVEADRKRAYRLSHQ
ncbi:MAG: hypothetical protein WKF81_01280 [Thermomicrobiales bacterium]